MIEYHDFPSVKNHRIALFTGLAAVLSNALLIALLAASSRRGDLILRSWGSVQALTFYYWNVNFLVTTACFFLGCIAALLSANYARRGEVERRVLLPAGFGLALNALCFLTLIVSKQLMYRVLVGAYYG